MKTLEIDESKVKECMKECPEFKSIAEKLWPELKEEPVDVTRECMLETCHDYLHIMHEGEYVGYVTDMNFCDNSEKKYELKIPDTTRGLRIYKK